MLESALRWADQKFHLLVDEADRAGRVRRGTRRSWLQTELAKAWIAQAEAGYPDAACEAERALQTLSDIYLGQPFDTGRVEQLDERGERLVGPVPASTLHHIFVAIVEADRILGDAKAGHRVATRVFGDVGAEA